MTDKYWHTTKTGRLKAPPHKKLKVVDISGTRINFCGDLVVKVGDYVYSYGQGIGAGTVGRVMSLRDHAILRQEPDPLWVAEIEYLSGEILSKWLWTIAVVPYNAVQEVKDFYIANGRPERIKVSW